VVGWRTVCLPMGSLYHTLILKVLILVWTLLEHRVSPQRHVIENPLWGFLFVLINLFGTVPGFLSNKNMKFSATNIMIM
jgi:hypothetical protein